MSDHDSSDSIHAACNIGIGFHAPSRDRSIDVNDELAAAMFGAALAVLDRHPDVTICPNYYGTVDHLLHHIRTDRERRALHHAANKHAEDAYEEYMNQALGAQLTDDDIDRLLGGSTTEG